VEIGPKFEYDENFSAGIKFCKTIPGELGRVRRRLCRRRSRRRVVVIVGADGLAAAVKHQDLLLVLMRSACYKNIIAINF
jgi:hypothetical protein